VSPLQNLFLHHPFYSLAAYIIFAKAGQFQFTEILHASETFAARFFYGSANKF